MMTTLVVAPHPDDEVLGCGGLIREYVSEGQDVHVCIVTEASSLGWSEQRLHARQDAIARSADLLGIAETHQLNYPAAELDTVTQRRINDDIADLVSQLKVNELFLPYSGDCHTDHRIVHRAGLVAARPHNDVDRVLAYETLSETEWGTDLPRFDPTVYVDISDHLDTKVEAMDAYQSEEQPFPHPRSERAIRAQAVKRGTEAHMTAAEAFELIRERR